MKRSRTQRLSLALAAAVLAACATARTTSTTRDLPLAARVQAPGMLFELLYTEPDVAQLGRIGGGLLAAGPRLARWGSFKQGVFIRVYPDHDSLEAAVDRHGYPWLRAWAYGDQVLLQSPRSWNGPSSSTPSAALPASRAAAVDEELSELLVHELTHTLMYQLIEPVDGRGVLDAPLEEPPLWFREGMASVTAGQGHRRLTVEELAQWLPLHPCADLLHPPKELYRTEKEAVYGAAHRAFELLVQLSGDQAVRDVLRAVRTGARFGDAFKAATGQTLAGFELDAIQRLAGSRAAVPAGEDHGEGSTGGRPESLRVRCSSISEMSTVGATVLTGT